MRLDGVNFDAPISVAIDTAGNVYAGAQSSSTVFKITPGGAISLVMDSGGDGQGHILNSPYFMATDPADNLYVASQGFDANVFKVTPAGAISLIMNADGDGESGLLLPGRGFPMDAAGNLYVSGQLTDNVFRITPGGTITEILDALGGGAGPFDGPRGLALDSAENLYAGCSGSSRVFRRTPGGTTSVVMTSAGDGVHPFIDFGDPTIDSGILAIDAADTVWVDGKNANLFSISAGGSIGWVGVTGVNYSAGVTIDGLGNLYTVGFRSNDAYRVSFGPTTTSSTTTSSTSTSIFGQTTSTSTSTSTSSSTSTTAPPTCLTSGCLRPTLEFKGRLAMKNKKADKGDSFNWTWVKGEETTLADLGDPLTATSYTLCVVDALRDRYFTATIPSGGLCRSKPCWRSAGVKGFKFRDPDAQHGGIQKLVLKPGLDGQAKVILKGKGANLAMPHLPMITPVRAQLQASNGTCWEAEFLEAGILKAGFAQFSAKASVPAGSPSGAFPAEP